MSLIPCLGASPNECKHQRAKKAAAETCGGRTRRRVQWSHPLGAPLPPVASSRYGRNNGGMCLGTPDFVIKGR
eukprot:4668177-Pyramimonas_sp.AAC.1